MLSLDFIFAGRAVFTVSNNSGDQFTFKIKKSKNGETFFANVLSGGYDSYTYMGVIDKNTLQIYKGNKGIDSNAKSVKVIEWAVKCIKNQKPLPIGYAIQHAGTCGKCGKELTDAQSIEIGLGPVCRNNLK